MYKGKNFPKKREEMLRKNEVWKRLTLYKLQFVFLLLISAYCLSFFNILMIVFIDLISPLFLSPFIYFIRIFDRCKLCLSSISFYFFFFVLSICSRAWINNYSFVTTLILYFVIISQLIDCTRIIFQNKQNKQKNEQIERNYYNNNKNV